MYIYTSYMYIYTNIHTEGKGDENWKPAEPRKFSCIDISNKCHNYPYVEQKKR